MNELVLQLAGILTGAPLVLPVALVVPLEVVPPAVVLAVVAWVELPVVEAPVVLPAVVLVAVLLSLPLQPTAANTKPTHSAR